MIAPSNAFVRELEETCVNEPDLRFNVPKNMEESKVKFEYKPTFTAQSKRKQEQQDEGHGGQDAFGNTDASDQRLRWYSVTELSGLICELCIREMQVNKSKVFGPNSKFNPTSCVNCCANWNADTTVLRGLSKGRSCIRDSSRNRAIRIIKRFQQTCFVHAAPPSAPRPSCCSLPSGVHLGAVCAAGPAATIPCHDRRPWPVW